MNKTYRPITFISNRMSHLKVRTNTAQVEKHGTSVFRNKIMIRIHTFRTVTQCRPLNSYRHFWIS